MTIALIDDSIFDANDEYKWSNTTKIACHTWLHTLFYQNQVRYHSLLFIIIRDSIAMTMTIVHDHSIAIAHHSIDLDSHSHSSSSHRIDRSTTLIITSSSHHRTITPSHHHATSTPCARDRQSNDNTREWWSSRMMIRWTIMMTSEKHFTIVIIVVMNIQVALPLLTFASIAVILCAYLCYSSHCVRQW